MASTLHSPGPAPSPAPPGPTPVAALSRRDRILIAGCTVLITVLAWAYLIRLDRAMSASAQANSLMASMGMAMNRAWGVEDVFFTFVMWSVMMVGMMTPSAMPVILVFAGAQARRTEQRLPLTVLLFGLGHLTVWVGFSALAACAQWALHQAALLSPAMATSSPRLAGAILIAAGAYQMAPIKGACLRHCRSPLGFLMTSWRDGNAGAFRMGLQHGAYCVGCCWALMGVLFVVGVMHLAWVALLAVFVLLEKTGTMGIRLSRAGGVLMIGFGALFLARSI